VSEEDRTRWDGHGRADAVDGVEPGAQKNIALHRHVTALAMRGMYADPSLAEEGAIYVSSGAEDPAPLPPGFVSSDEPGYVFHEPDTGKARVNADPSVFAAPAVKIAAANKYTAATAAIKFKFKRAAGFSVSADQNVFYRVKGRVKNIHTGTFFDIDASWIPQAAAYDFCTVIKYNFPEAALPASFAMSNDADGFFGWIPLETGASYHWEASAEMWAADTGDGVIPGVYGPIITFEASNPAVGRTKTVTVLG
jgi:hypothetical protein